MRSIPFGRTRMSIGKAFDRCILKATTVLSGGNIETGGKKSVMLSFRGCILTRNPSNSSNGRPRTYVLDLIKVVKEVVGGVGELTYVHFKGDVLKSLHPLITVPVATKQTKTLYSKIRWVPQSYRLTSSITLNHSARHLKW